MSKERNTNYYNPPSAFHFEVLIDSMPGVQASFQEVSGIDVTAEVEPISEAGLNSYSHRVPKRTSYPNLILKRGLLIDDSAMMDWVEDTIQGGLNQKIKPKNLTVSLMGKNGEPLQSWSIVNAYPVKWSLGGLNSGESAHAFESIELAYSYWEFA